MKNEFFGFYEPTPEEINKAWENGIFVFDANSLLNLYRYSESTRKDFLLAITKLKENLFMPHQVGYEYHSNRNSVIEALNNASNTLFNSLKDNHEKTLQNLLNQYLRHPSIQIETIKKIQDDFINKVSSELEKQKKNHPDFKSNDEVLVQLTDLFENKVGPAFNKEDLKKIYLEGKDRYDQLVPPGYKDLDTKRKKGDQHIYGDLIIWKELISLAKKEKKEIIFITDDRKEDWWTIENGKTIRPREELIKEFYDLTRIRILIYNADNFLRYAKERKLITKIKDTTINEIKTVRQSDENYITVLNWLQNNENKNSWLKTSADILKAQESLKGFEWYKKYNPIAEFYKNNDVLKNYNWSTSHLNDYITEIYKKTNLFKTSSDLETPSPFVQWVKNINDLENKVELNDITEKQVINLNTSENVVQNESQDIQKIKKVTKKNKSKESDD